MMPEEKILIKNLKHEGIDLNFKQKAIEALSINNLEDLKKYIERYNINMIIDITESIEENKERLYYLLNEEFYNLRENNINLF
ncbi:hypothetical protein C3L23_03360 [Nautilia sp. PV-1]|uniref:hypothetical protein n=1 Tax=Nautilia sp. PV-1 TaxID=2579250 RepID=UPI000FDC022E|nr:hypothetical protein [Nautilia sp. PV-1]AZV46341.1 hypothetical protein C3L23_03360 [Nautilia sp. PV-1]